MSDLLAIATLSALAFVGAMWAALRSLRNRTEPEPELDPEPELELDDQGAELAELGVSSRVLAWAPELEAARGSVPLPFLLRWMQRESDGNPCSLGRNDGVGIEAGIGQVFFSPPGSVIHGTSADKLRAGCSGQTLTRELTQDERAAQVSSLVDMAGSYIIRAGRALSSRNLTWRQEDILALAKLVHALPILTTVYLSEANAVGQADSWGSFRSFLDALTREQALRIWSGIGIYYPLSRYTKNASYAATGQE